MPTFWTEPFCASSKGSTEAERVRRLAWAFSNRASDKCQNLIISSYHIHYTEAYIFKHANKDNCYCSRMLTLPLLADSSL